MAGDPSGHPSTHYGVYKFANEGTARIYGADDGIPSVGIRPYVVYGVGRDQGMTSSPTFAMLAAAVGRPWTISYSGTSHLQLASDTAAAFCAVSCTAFAFWLDRWAVCLTSSAVVDVSLTAVAVSAQGAPASAAQTGTASPSVAASAVAKHKAKHKAKKAAKAAKAASAM